MQNILHALGFVLVEGTVFLALISGAHRRRARPRDPPSQRRRPHRVGGQHRHRLPLKDVRRPVRRWRYALFFDDVRAWGLQFTPSQPWVGWLVLFVVTDFLFYMAHFVLHKVRDGWCSHIAHHSSTRYNQSTALRQSFLFDLSSLASLWWVPLALVGLDKLSIIVAVELKLFYQFFVHTEVAGRLPNWFEAIFKINTPSHHRVHHGRNAAQIDTNVGGVLIIRDRFFGTFVDERNAGEIVYGVSHRQPTLLNRLRLNLGDWIAMWRNV